MDCAKCGKHFGFLDSQRKLRNKDVHPELYNKTLCLSCFNILTRVNEVCPKCGKEFGFVLQAKEWVSTELFPEWNGQYLHQECWIEEKRKETLCFNCGFCEETINNDNGPSNIKSYLDEGYSTYRCGKFSLNLSKDENTKAMKCSSFINQNEYQNRCIIAEMEKAEANVVAKIVTLDFISLKNILTKSGLEMTTFKCQNCRSRVNIPESGEILVCPCCQTSIRPMDILSKIKSLL
jgi:hypothetical protein